MARLGRILLAVAVGASGCTTVRLAQKDGCWVRRSERWLGGMKEDIGPCIPPDPKWSDDRLTRLVQECVVRADHRWQARAVDAWNRGQPLPEHANEETTLKQCLGEPTREVLAENDALKKRLAELTSDRDALKTSEQESRAKLASTYREMASGYEKLTDKVTEYLGTAANKAQAPASATATASADSEGTAHTQSAHDATTSLAADTSSQGQPGTVMVATAPEGSTGARGAAPPAKKARAARPRPAVRASAPVCPPEAAAPAGSASPDRKEAVWAPVLLAPPSAPQHAAAP